MTRLVKDDVWSIGEKLKAYDVLFQSQTGYTMREIAKFAAGFHQKKEQFKTAVVPVTSGLGVISGFSTAVAAILRHGGADAFVTSTGDVNGIYEGITKGAEVLFLADDERYLAINLRTGTAADNGICTGEGFAEALIQAMKDRREKVLILGASNVGGAAAAYFAGKGIPVDIYDTNPAVLEALQLPETMVTKCFRRPRLKNYRYLYDATTAADLITAGDVGKETVIAAPGMPRGITEKACGIATVIHNPLELGTLAMYYQCIRETQKPEETEHPSSVFYEERGRWLQWKMKRSNDTSTKTRDLQVW